MISDFRFLDFVSITNIKLPEIEFHIVSLSNIFKYIVSSSDRLFSRKKILSVLKASPNCFGGEN